MQPRWDNAPKRDKDDAPDDILYPVQTQYIRENVQWVPYRRIARYQREPAHSDRSETRIAIRKGDLVAKDRVPLDWPHAGVQIRQVREAKWVQESLSKTWAKYFIGVADEEADTHPYPALQSEEFARRYAEPVDDFLDAALAFRDAVEILGEAGPVEQSSKQENERARYASAILNGLLNPVSPAMVLQDDGAIKQFWVAPTLLGSFAMMALQDLSDPYRQFLRCQACQQMFVSRSYQAAYCSETCRRTAYKRRRRTRERPSGNQSKSQ
jgi:hypothetical protein